MMYEMLYPDKQWVSGRKLKSMAADVVSDETGVISDPNNIPVDDAILILADSGLVTISTRTRE